VVGWTTYVCLICTLKMAMLVFYIRLMVCSDGVDPYSVGLLICVLDRKDLATIFAFVYGSDLGSSV
jgi:hypothetical protein